MDPMQPQEAPFLFRRLTEECPQWAVAVPVLFAFLVVALIVMFRQDHKLRAAIVGGTVVGIISAVYVLFGLFTVKIFSWMVILVPVMGVAFFYVGLMYLRDAKSVHWLWAVFLGLLRSTVYLILAGVFLLPGCQHYEKQEYESKVVFLFDVSDSMLEKDDPLKEGQDPLTLLSRQDKVIKLLNKGDEPFMNRVVDKSPVFAYRFGSILDETDLVALHRNKERSIPVKQWEQFLKPNKNDVKPPNLDGVKDEDEKKDKIEQFQKRQRTIAALRQLTNIGGACLSAHKLENNSFIQAFVVISDGQSNTGSDESRADFLARANNPKNPIPVITVGVGQFRMPTTIRIDDLNAPSETRPDDKFPVRVPVVSTGLNGKPFEVTLEIKRIKDINGKEVEEDEQTFVLPAKQGIFKGAGDQQQGIVQFEIDVMKLRDLEKVEDDKNNTLEGEWRIIAKTPRHKDESFTEPFHVSDPVKVHVQKKKLRILLFAGDSTREYVFLRGVLYREMKEERMEFCIYNQTTVKQDDVDQDLPPERMLADFPNTMGLNRAGEQFMSLNDYDVIIAFDPDWTRLTLNQRLLLNKWVGENAGGLIFIAGPVFSHQLARAGGQDFSKLLPLIPVVLKDARLHGLGLGDKTTLGHDPTRPYALNFTPAANRYDFLRLDENSKNPTAGWDSFFWGDEPYSGDPNAKPKKGFFTYYPVDRLKTASEVVATFNGPKESRIGDKTDAFKDQQPFIVGMPYGAGKSLYVGSGEFWRMRFLPGFHERLWIKMARYVGAGAKEQKKYGRILMAGNAPVGRIEFEAQIKGSDLLPLSSKYRPTVFVKRIPKKSETLPDAKDKDKDKEKKDTKDKQPGKTDEVNLRFDLQPKVADEGETQGYFAGSIYITDPGEYEFKLPIPEVEGESLRRTIYVRKTDPETDNKRTNFGYLYQLASPSDSLLKNLPPDTRRKIESILQVPEGQTAGEKFSKRLFFTVDTADSIADCLVQVPSKTDKIKGPFEHIWDADVERLLVALGWMEKRDPSEGKVVSIFWAVLATPVLVGLIGMVILLLFRQWMFAGVFLLAGVALSAMLCLFCYLPMIALVLGGGGVALAALATVIVFAFKKEYFGIGVIVVGCGLLAGLAGYLGYRMPDGTIGEFALSLRTDALPLGFSFVLIIAVALVGIEWLTRKLLRLA